MNTRARRWARMAGGVAFVAWLSTGCWVDRLEGKACDDAHDCVEGYVCVASICLDSDALDAGVAGGPNDEVPDDVTDADAG